MNDMWILLIAYVFILYCVIAGKRGQNLVLVKSKLNDTFLSLRNVGQDIKQKERKYAFTDNKKTQVTGDHSVKNFFLCRDAAYVEVNDYGVL